jgi:alpha-tubulin suppressor-like RCC1 family protein
LNDYDEELPENEQFVYRRTPFNIQFKEKVARVSCGRDFSACLTASGKLYTWGNNKWGNLGLNPSDVTMKNFRGASVVTTPILVKDLEHMQLIQIVCGDKHMIALSNERRIYSWGDGSDGALGHSTFESSPTPNLIKDLASEDIIFICAGFTSSAAINSKGQLYTWGSGKYGQLGLGTREKIKNPMKVLDGGILNDRVFFISIGYYHTVCCTCK